MEADDEIGGGDGGAGDVIGLLQQLIDGGDALLDRDGGAALFLNGAGAQGAGRTGEGDERFDLVGLAAEAEEEDAGEVGVGGVADEDATQEIGGFAVFGHATTGAVGDGDDAVDVGIGVENLRGEVCGDAAGYSGRAVDGGEDADEVAGGDAAVRADDAFEGCGFIDEFGGAGLGADGVVALKVTGDKVVGVDVFACGDRLGGEADDLVELTNGLAGGDGMKGEFMPGGDIGGRNEAQTVEGLARRDGLEGDHYVVRASELESVGTQPFHISEKTVAVAPTELVVRPHSTPTAQQRIVPTPTWTMLCKVFYLMEIRLDFRRRS